MSVHIAVKIQGYIQIDDTAAEVLLEMSGFDFAEWFNGTRGRRFTKEEITTALGPIRSKLHEIVQARDAAINGIDEKFRPKK